MWTCRLPNKVAAKTGAQSPYSGPPPSSGDTHLVHGHGSWPLDRLNESMAFLELKLQGQLNLYRLEMNPFADVRAKKAPRVV